MIYLFVLVLTLVMGAATLRFHRRIFLFAIPRDDQRARQASHVGDPVRYGGIAIFIGLVIGAALMWTKADMTEMSLLLLSTLPVVVIGLAEDLGHAMSPARRLAAAAVSAVVAMVLLGAWVPRGDIVLLDRAMEIWGVAVVLTVLFSAGFCHAFNLIDGMNGLAALNAVLSGVGVAAIASVTGQTDIEVFTLVLVACLVGFLMLNWPSARIFLGDAGAYGVGHVLAWLCFLLVWRDGTIAVPAMLLVLFWPLADVFHTIARRIAARKAAFAPDRLHLHHKIRRALDLRFFGYNARAKSNPLTTLLLVPFILMPVAAGVVLRDQPAAAWTAFIVFTVGFSLAHLFATRAALAPRRAG